MKEFDIFEKTGMIMGIVSNTFNHKEMLIHYLHITYTHQWSRKQLWMGGGGAKCIGRLTQNNINNS